MTRPLFPSAKGLTRQASGVRDAVINLINESDRKWGCDRLRLLVSDETRDRWDRQLIKLEKALQSTMAGDIRRHAEGVRKGLEIMEREAAAAGHQPLDPQVWTVQLGDGTTIAIVQGQIENLAVCDVYDEVYTLTEIGRLIEARPELRLMKKSFGGAEIAGIGAKGPMNWETGDDIDDLGREPPWMQGSSGRWGHDTSVEQRCPDAIKDLRIPSTCQAKDYSQHAMVAY